MDAHLYKNILKSIHKEGNYYWNANFKGRKRKLNFSSQGSKKLPGRSRLIRKRINQDSNRFLVGFTNRGAGNGEPSISSRTKVFRFDWADRWTAQQARNSFHDKATLISAGRIPPSLEYLPLPRFVSRLCSIIIVNR